jgi:putative membrane protein
MEMEQKERIFKNSLLLYAKGLGMGAADIVPGVSGGTIALITGIYEELINSLRSFTPKNFKLIFSKGIKSFWKAINGNFLVAVVLGIGTSLVSLARVVLYMLHTHPVVTWSFFFGLIVISTISVLKTIRKITMPVFIGFGAGAVVAYLITVSAAVQTPNDFWFIFVCGAVVICAMILPGISGSFILLLMGKYEYILSALNGFKVAILAVFASGAIIGLLSFSHFLSWLLRKYRDVTVALLAGFMCGSLNKVWPWKVQVNTANREVWPWSMEKFNDHSLTLMEKNHLPPTFEQVTGVDSNLYWGIAAAILAIAVYMTIETIGKKMEAKK